MSNRAYRSIPEDRRDWIDELLPLAARIGGDNPPSAADLKRVWPRAWTQATALARSGDLKGVLPDLERKKRHRPKFDPKPKGFSDAAWEALQEEHFKLRENVGLRADEDTHDIDVDDEVPDAPPRRGHERPAFPERPEVPPGTKIDRVRAPGRKEDGQPLERINLALVFKDEYRALIYAMGAASEKTPRKTLWNVSQMWKQYRNQVHEWACAWDTCQEPMRSMRERGLQGPQKEDWIRVRSIPCYSIYHFRSDIWETWQGKNFTAVMDAKRRTSPNDQARHRLRARKQYADPVKRAAKLQAQKLKRSQMTPEQKAKEAERKRSARAAKKFKPLNI
jgi:hypothetical protein